MPVLKNQKHEIFARAVAQGRTADQAYEEAGYKPNRHNASRLRNTNENVRARIEEIKGQKTEKVIEKAAISRIWVLDMLRENAERAMQHHPVLGPEGEEIGEYTYNGSVANRALELIGKEIGLFVDRKEFRYVNEFEKLSDEQLVVELAQTAQLLLTDQTEKEEE